MISTSLLNTKSTNPIYDNNVHPNKTIKKRKDRGGGRKLDSPSKKTLDKIIGISKSKWL